jgi:DNA ligase (NAD+)
LPDIGPEVAENVILFFTNHRGIVEHLLEEVHVQFNQTEIVSEWKYLDKKVCITGSFDWYSRDELVEILEKQGWSFVGSVSKNTDFLLAWEKAGSKLTKANELWVVVLSLEEFLVL